MRRTLTFHSSESEGATLIEFALVMPVLVLIILGIFDLGWAIYAHNTISYAAREGARTGIIFSKTDTDICNQASSEAPGLGLTCGSTGNIRISPPGTRTRSAPITVTIIYTYTPFTPLIGNILGNGNLILTGQSSMIVE